MQRSLVLFLSMIVATKVVGFTTGLLQPFAVAYLVSCGFGDAMMSETRRGVFSCSLSYIKRLLPKHKWRSVKPGGDAKKLPANWKQLGHDMLLRLAYFVFLYSIPEALVVNSDHTGCFLVPAKGKAWITEEMAEAGDKKVKGQSDKRQLTVLASSTPRGLLRSQAIWKGKTRASLPFKGLKIFALAMIMLGASTLLNGCKRPSHTACFSLLSGTAVALSGDEGSFNLGGIGSWCVTGNHWADDVTSCAHCELRSYSTRSHMLKLCSLTPAHLCVQLTMSWIHT
jgi:hypothetical protein